MGKRTKKRYGFQMPIRHSWPYAIGTGPRGEPARDVKEKLLDEAQFLIGINHPIGEQFRTLINALPMASLERLAQ